MAKIVITTSKDRTININGVDIVGNRCDKEFDIFCNNIDGVMVSNNKKPEYYESVETNMEMNTENNFE